MVQLRPYLNFVFFQAEDGIRYLTVTGVQTCALPISLGDRERARAGAGRESPGGPSARAVLGLRGVRVGARHDPAARRGETARGAAGAPGAEIGRAACRGRGEISGGGGSFKKKKRR